MNHVLFAFNGDPVCFVHVLRNAIDMNERGWPVKIVMEGAATGLISELAIPSSPLHPAWEKVKSLGLVAGVCKACSMKMKTLESAQEQGLAILGDMAGHPPMASFIDEGFTVITF